MISALRPYIAILKDSFREALSSRVLWILLIVATLMLLAIAGFGISEQAGSYLHRGEISDARALTRKLAGQGDATRASPGRRIWSLLDSEVQTQLSEIKAQPPAEGVEPGLYELRDQLNELLARRDLYEAESWTDARLDPEARELIARGVDALSDDELARFNRLLLEAAFPAEISPAQPRESSISYFGAMLGSPLPLRRSFLVNTALVAFIQFIVGMLGVFAGILVTASIIPHTFEAGAVDLLLSKPISRSLLFLTKFAGGCAFILINTAYIIGGLWLIVGFRFGTWSQKLWWCVPIFMFVFAVYYSVSALAGLLWKNAIVSVVMTIVFWGLCFTVGTIKNVVERAFLDEQRLTRLIPLADPAVNRPATVEGDEHPPADSLLAVNEQGQVFRWHAGEERWEETFIAENQPRWGRLGGLIGPVYDPLGRRLVAARDARRRFGLFSSGPPLMIGRAQDDWRPREGVAAPAGTAALLTTPDGRLLAVASDGLFRLEGDGLARGPKLDMFGWQVPVPILGGGGRFAQVGPDLRLVAPFSAAIDPRSGVVAIFNRETLTLLEPADGRYRERARRDLPDSDSGLVGLAGSTVLLALADGRVLLFDAADLTPRGELAPREKSAPRFVESSPDGRFFAVLFHDRRLWLYDTAGTTELQVPRSAQGDISAVAFGGPTRLLIADRLTRVTEFDLPAFVEERRLAPAMDTLERIYRYGIKPLYTVFPKPGEMSNVITWLVTDEQTAAVNPEAFDLRSRRVPLDVWGPIWSNLAFVAVMLGLGCLYMRRKDF